MSKKLHNRLVAAVSVLVFVALAYVGGLLGQRTPEPAGEWYTVTRVVDGDTIVVTKNGMEDRVRLLGIDTPETVHPTKEVECFGKEASNFTTHHLAGERVQLETDQTQGLRDQHDRLLAYVYLGDGSLFNQTLVHEGYAYEYTYDEPYKYQRVFRQAERDAREQKDGLWADGVCE